MKNIMTQSMNLDAIMICHFCFNVMYFWFTGINDEENLRELFPYAAGDLQEWFSL